MTVEKFLQEHPADDFKFMTPCGYLNLTAEDAQRLLNGQPACTNLGVQGSSQTIHGEEILNQELIDEPFLKDGYWYAMTQDPTPTMTMNLY